MEEELQPNPLLLKALNYFSNHNKKALDLGSGHGQDAIYLAKLGFIVTAIDNNPLMIHKTQQLANIHKVIINTKTEDFRTLTINDQYNLLISLGVIHFLPNNEEIEKVIRKMQTITSKGGIQVLTTFIQSDLRNYYSNNSWEILHWELKKDQELIVRKR